MYPVHFLTPRGRVPSRRLIQVSACFTPPNISEQNVKVLLYSACVERRLTYLLVTALLRDPARHAVDIYSSRSSRAPRTVPGPFECGGGGIAATPIKHQGGAVRTPDQITWTIRIITLRFIQHSYGQRFAF